MSALQSVITKRDHFVSILAFGGSREKYESLLDYLLSWEVLNWEEYEKVSILGQPLSSLVRELLDILTCKGEDGCRLFLDALDEMANGPHEDGNCLHTPEDLSKVLSYLRRERPRIVRKIHNHIDEIFNHLVTQDCMSKYEADSLQLPIYSPSQKARRLIDLLWGKGNESARCLISFIQHLQHGMTQLSHVDLGYQKKMKSVIAAQSQYLSTYDGGANMCLESIYTENVLELGKSSTKTDFVQSPQNPLSLLDIFNADGLINKNADTVLLLGDAGSGKTTLLHQIHCLWAEGQAFHNFCYIFPFSCRKLCCISDMVSLQTLLFDHCCWPDQSKEDIFSFILSSPSRVLFTFDGFDEFKFAFMDDHKHCSPTNPTSIGTLVFNLLQGNLMKDSIKMVTSRPYAVTAVFKKYVRKEVHLKGFSEAGIELFMKKHHDDPEISRRIVSLVKANSSLLGLCHIPVFSWIVSTCHKELFLNSFNSPQTITDMYFLTLKHFLQHAAPGQKFVDNLLEQRINSIRHLGKLALTGLCHGLFVFSHQQIVDAEVNEQDISLGFLILSKNVSLDNTFSSQHYEFIHTTFQCFFAALYIAVSDDVKTRFIKSVFNWTPKSSTLAEKFRHLRAQENNTTSIKDMDIQNLQITANFVAGLFSQRLYKLITKSWQPQNLSRKLTVVTKCLSKAIHKHFKSIPPAVKGEAKTMHAMPQFVWLVKCIYEMQNTDLSRKAVVGLEVDHLKMTFCGIGPAECTALAYVLKHLKSPSGIQLDHNSVGDTGIDQLLPCLHICKALYLRDNNISDKGICKLLDQATRWPNFQKIALFNNKLTDECAGSFANLLKHKQNFLALRLGNNFITEAGAVVLAEGLRENKSIQFLGFWGNRVGDIGAEAIAVALRNNKSLIWLSLVANNIGSPGAQALAAMLQENTALEELCLEENNIQDQDVILFAEALKKNRTLKVLKLSKNCIGVQGVSALAEALQHNSTITSIWLNGTNLTSEEVQKFYKLECRLSL
ncbi:nucleotide-binding oligomerization domain-containing protein 2 [Spea bombifrons]|uniref:nucleotide-binding oligomerization domain-containing protein 2 n=1 Tax=Spea bombifrons TaxID=233779 RepID=UPI002349D170|nr:nucleotide-binding oligomerization domain-containing protein 2 [Spea bombifrons]